MSSNSKGDDVSLFSSEEYEGGNKIPGENIFTTQMKNETVTNKDANSETKKKWEVLEQKKKDLETDRKKHNRSRKEGIANYNIRAIEFDWIFNETEGKKLLQTLAEIDDEEIYDVEVIRNVVLYLWKFFRRVIIWKLMIPLVIHFM